MKKIMIISGLFLLLSLGIMVTRKPHTQRQSASDGQPKPTIQATIGGKSISEYRQAQQPVAATKRMISEQLASDYKMSQIAQIESRGNTNILVFNDGSRIHVTDFIENQLPHHIQYRLDYSLKGGAPARHGN